jgi:hypothetical protein
MTGIDRFGRYGLLTVAATIATAESATSLYLSRRICTSIAYRNARSVFEEGMR